MAQKIIIPKLSQEDKKSLQRLFTKDKGRNRNPGKDRKSFPVERAADTHLIRLPIGGIPGLDWGTFECEAVQCEILGLFGEDELKLTLDTEPDADTIPVFNPYPVKWYRGAAEVIVEVKRIKGGQWITARPNYTVKVKPIANIPAGGSGLCEVYEGDGAEEDITVFLNWMHGDELIMAGREAYAEYRDSEGRFVFVNAECEVE